MKILLVGNKCFKYLGKCKSGFIMVSILKLAAIIISLVNAFYMSRILACFSIKDKNMLKIYLGILIGGYVFSLLVQYVQFTLKQYVEKTSRTELKKNLINMILNNFPVYYKKESYIGTAKANEILYTDVNNITTFLFSVVNIITSVLTIFLTGILLFSVNKVLALTITIIFTVAAVWVHSYSIRLKKINIELRDETDIHFKLARDILKNVKYIRASNSIEFHYDRFAHNVEQVKKSTLYRDKKMWLVGYLSTVINSVWLIFFLSFSVYQLGTNQFYISGFMLFFTYSKLYSSSLTGVLSQYSDLQQLVVSVERVFELINLCEQTEEKNKVEFPTDLRQIKISELRFCYDNRTVIENLDKDIVKSPVLVVGANGKGKTTFLNLLAGILPVQRGAIFYNNVSADKISFQSLSRALAYASQGDVLFDMSIKENILCFDGADYIEENELVDMCAKVGILDDILTLEKKFDTQIGEIRDFSFGQKKKILLARAFLKKSQMMIFDEPLEGLDVETQQKVIELIAEVSQQKFVFIATHKPDVFSFCEDVLEL